MSLQISEFQDIDQFIESVASTMNQHSVQIQPGVLLIKDYLLEIDDICISYFSSNRNLLDHFSISPEYLRFVLTSTTQDNCNWCGIDVPVNAIGVLHADREHQSFTPEGWDEIAITIKKKTVMQECLLSEQLWKQTIQPEKAVYECVSPRIKLLRKKLFSYFQTPEKLKTYLTSEPAKLHFKNWVLNELRMIFWEIENQENSNKTSVRTRSRRYHIFTKAIAAIEANLTNQLSVVQICEQIGITPRTLQLCFKELSGISPLQYIAARKLHAVQQEIFSLTNPSTRISHIAQDYGLTHAGRFSAQYKRMYSELPSETLKRRGLLYPH